MASSAQLVKELRDRTGAGVMDCKEALQEARGSLEAAIAYLRKKGLAQAAKRAHIAREDVPAAVVEREREVYRAQLADQKKPPQIVDKIVEGKLEKFFGEQCLLEQPFIKDASGKTRVRDLVDGVNAKTGERVVVKRFARFQVGEAG